MIPFRALLYHMVTPTLEERHILQLSPVPRRGIFGQTFKHKQRPDKRAAQCGRVYPEPVPVWTTAFD